MDINSAKRTLGDLAKPIMFAVAMLGVSTALFSSSIIYFRQLKNQHESAQQAYRTIKNDLLATKVEIETARKYALAFRALSESNATGDFAKQRALDYLEQALSENLVIPKSYSLAARQTLTTADFAGLDQHEVSRHTVTMEMQLPHELRLLALIERMTEPNPGGITAVEACEIMLGKNEGKELTSSQSSIPTAMPLNSRCQLSWYRFVEKAPAPANGLPALNSPLIPNTPSIPNTPTTPLTAATFGSPPGKK
jgi:type II secretory pathway pseudopilin PulG